jgi:hypothetical protein
MTAIGNKNFNTQSTTATHPLLIELCGEGNLPRVRVYSPVLKNKREQPVIMFQQTLIGRMRMKQLVLVNEGSLPAKVGSSHFLSELSGNVERSTACH